MKRYFIISVIFCALSCGVSGQTSLLTDSANIQGTWLAQTESQNGITKKVPFVYVFKGDTISFTDETGKETKYLFRLDSIDNLRFINIWPEGTPTDSTPVSVAYALQADSLTMVIAPAGLRPTEISDNNNQELIICKRKKK